MTKQSTPAQFSRIIPYLALTGLVLLYMAVAVAHAALAPLTTGPDELAHYEYVRFIADHGRLPLTYAEREQASYKSDQPPLYHLLAALPAALVDPAGPPFLKRVSDDVRRQLIERTRHAWGLYNTEDELWPYRAEVLRWQMGRWVAILLGAATVVVTFFLAREVFGRIFPASTGGRNFALALAAAAIVAFIPRFVLTGSMLNYETTEAFFCALFLWMLLRITCHASRITYHVFLLGLLAGLAILTKLSAIILPLEVLVALWLIQKYVIRNTQYAVRFIWLRHALIFLLTIGLVISLWFGFVVYQFNTVAQDGWWAGLLHPLIAADSSDATTNQLLSLLTRGQVGFTAAIENLDSGPPWQWLAIFFRTFWVTEIEQHLPLGWAGLAAVLLLGLVAGYGLVGVWRQSSQVAGSRVADSTVTSNKTAGGETRLLLGLLSLHLLWPVVLPLLRYAMTFSLADTAQGRHVLFMAAPALAILLVWGGEGVRYQVSGVKYQVLRFTPYVFPLFLLLWTIVQLWFMTWAYLPLLPVRTTPEAKAQAERQLNQPLTEAVTLVGYNSYLDNQNLRLDLFWRATAVSPVDYLTEVSLLDDQGQAQSQWLGYAAGGRYPTRAWDKGDLVRDTVWLPVGRLPAGQYQVQLKLKPTAQSLPDRPLPTLLKPITLDSITLSDSPPPPLSASDAARVSLYTLWQKGRPLTGPQPFGERETILVTMNPPLSNPPPKLQLTQANAAKSGNGVTFDPVFQSEYQAIFIVGPNWPTGDYALRATGPAGQFYQGERLAQVLDRWQRQFSPPPIQHKIEANFANQIKLLGYDLGANRAAPGGGIPLTLYWQGLDWMGDDYTIFVKLLSVDKQVHGGRDRLPREGYSTLYWAPGEIVTDPFGVPVNANAPDGVYYVNIGLYKPVKGQAVSLPLVQDGQPIAVSSVNLGPVKIGRAPAGLTRPFAAPQVTLNQPFGDPPALTLLGYDLTDETGQPLINSKLPIANFKLTLYWRSESPLPVDYTTFVHLRNAAGETVAQKDQPPLQGAYPTSLWDAGEIVADEIAVPLSAPLPAGGYKIVVGLYDFKTGQRLTVPGQPANEVTLTNVTGGF